MGIPDHFGGDDPHNHRKLSRRHEEKVGIALVQRNSGAVAHHRGDVKTKEMLIECKATNLESISIKREWIEKITMEATQTGKIPGFSFQFATEEDRKKKKPIVYPIEREWMAVPLTFFEELIAAYRREHEDSHS